MKDEQRVRRIYSSSFILPPSSLDSMTPEQWQKVEEVLQGALDRPMHERASFLNEACGGDDRLTAEATSLVNAYDQAGDFIEQPALALDARVLIGDDLEEKI